MRPSAGQSHFLDYKSLHAWRWLLYFGLLELLSELRVGCSFVLFRLSLLGLERKDSVARQIIDDFEVDPKLQSIVKKPLF